MVEFGEAGRPLPGRLVFDGAVFADQFPRDTHDVLQGLPSFVNTIGGSGGGVRCIVAVVSGVCNDGADNDGYG